MPKTMIQTGALDLVKDRGDALIPLSRETLEMTRKGGLRLAGSLAAVAAAGLLYRVSGWESPWLTLNILPPLAGTSAFLLLAIGLLGGGTKEALLAIVGSGAAFTFACTHISGADHWLAAAFATHAVVSAILERRIAEEFVPAAGLWSTFSAAMTVLLLS